MVQDTLTISAYYTKFKKMYEDVECVTNAPKCICVCNCKAKDEKGPHEEKMKVTQFLMGLSESFTNIRGQLLMMNPMPNMTQTLSLLQQDERQRNYSHLSPGTQESTALAATTTNKFVKSEFKKSAPELKGTKPKKSLECTHCHGTNHTKDRCYHLIGFPPRNKGPNKFNKNQTGSNSKVLAQVTSVEENSSGMNSADARESSSSALTHDQYEQLIHLLNQSTTNSSVSAPQSGRHYSMCSSMTTLCLTSCHTTTDWILDTGATDHITCQSHLLQNSQTCDVKICLPNGAITHVHLKGQVQLTSNLLLSDVLLISDFQFNLISIGKLTQQLKSTILFNTHHCVIQDPMRKVMGIGKLHGGLYKLLLPDSTTSAVNLHSSTVLAASSKDQSQLWHDRLGHTPISVIKNIDSLSTNVNVNSTLPCDVCHFAKQSRLAFPVSNSKAATCFELIHCDVWGPYKRPTFHTCHCFLTIVDDYSRATWTYFLSSKSQVFEIFKQFICYVHTQFNTTIRCVRTDNGTEFLNKPLTDLFLSLGINHQHSCVHTPQQNGRAERKHRHLLSVARALRFKSSLPMHLWGYCILTATYLINRTPSSVLGNKSPYEMLYSKTPKYSHLRVFGYLCFSSTLSKRQDKFYPRAYKCVLIGYSTSQKAYKLLHLDSNTVFTSRDVVFYENVFPFEHSSTHTPMKMFPSENSFVDDIDFHINNDAPCTKISINQNLPPNIK